MNLATKRGVQGRYEPDEHLGVHSLTEVVLAVPDLEEARRFYAAFGLDVREEGPGLALYTYGHPHRWARLFEGPRKQRLHLSFGCFEDDLVRFRKALEAEGVALVDAPAGSDTGGLWFRDFEGSLLEINIAPKSTADAKSRVDELAAPPGHQGAPFRRSVGQVRPTRLSHVMMFTSNISKAIEFYVRHLGLRLSDRAGNIVAFLHGAHGSDHHLIGFAGSDGPGFHHVSWDVPAIDDVGVGAELMAARGYARGWGFGRHVLGSNYFHYVRDPWGSWSEYSCGIDYVPAGFEWQASDNDPGDSFYLFGPPPPADFTTNYEVSVPPFPPGAPSSAAARKGHSPP